LNKILVFYDHFTPAWKAGGPIRSLEELLRKLSSKFNFLLICSGYDYNEDHGLIHIEFNKWTNWENHAQVLYNKENTTHLKTYKKWIYESCPDKVYINGLFSLYYNILPLLAAIRSTKTKTNLQIIVAPRGMLHPAALKQKWVKKKLYLTFFKVFGLPKKIHWHATDSQEAEYIRSQFGNVKISIASNFPNYFEFLKSPSKEKGSLILGTIALISPMKNHLEVLKSLKTIPYNITWHIFGPVKDTSYWKDCESFIRTLPENIKVEVHGPVTPNAVSEALEKIQVFILPSKSENFGHAILEALSAGKPVITTDTTPFTDLTEKQAGITIPIHTLSQSLSSSIRQFADMSQHELETFQISARNYALSRFDTASLIQDYERLFTSQ